MALGSDAGRVRGMILMQGMRIALAGVALGLLGAFTMGRLLTSPVPPAGVPTTGQEAP